MGRPLGHWGRGTEDAQLSQQKSLCNSDTACALEGLFSSGFSAYIMHISHYKYKTEMKPYFFSIMGKLLGGNSSNILL